MIELYEYHARTLGLDPEGDSVSPDAVALTQPAPTYKLYRLCGFLPIPFVWRPAESKSILPEEPSKNYGTLITNSEVATTSQTRKDGYTPLSGSNSRPGSSSGRQDPHVQQASKAGPSTFASHKSQSTAIKRSKSKERVAFTPPAVSNLERMQSAKTPKGAAQSKASDNNTPKPTNGWEAPVEAPSDRETTSNGWMSDSSAKVRIAAVANRKGSAPSINQQTKSSNIQANPSTSNATTTVAATPQKSILKKDTATPTSNTPAPQPAATTATQSASSSAAPAPPSAAANPLAMLMAARSDPVSFLEKHPMFHGRKAKTLLYDDSQSTPTKCIIRIRIDNVIVSQSAATISDHRLAKARAAFKAIEALQVGRCISYSRGSLLT